MEGYAAVSNAANRKLTRKRPFRNLERKAPALKDNKTEKTVLSISDKAAMTAKWEKIGKLAKTRFLITESLIYLLFFGLIVLAVYYFLFTVHISKTPPLAVKKWGLGRTILDFSMKNQELFSPRTLFSARSVAECVI